MAEFYETTVKESGNQPKLAANWIISELLGALNKAGLELDASPISSAQLGKLISRIADDTISGKNCQNYF